jgi:hypothetical protein
LQSRLSGMRSAHAFSTLDEPQPAVLGLLLKKNV